MLNFELAERLEFKKKLQSAEKIWLESLEHFEKLSKDRKILAEEPRIFKKL